MGLTRTGCGDTCHSLAVFCPSWTNGSGVKGGVEPHTLSILCSEEFLGISLVRRLANCSESLPFFPWIGSFLISYSLISVFHLIPPVSQEEGLHKAFLMIEKKNAETNQVAERSDIS